MDRLTRRPIELEEFVAVLDAAKVRRVRFVVGDTDLGTGDGLMVARMLGAMAANEPATKSRRLRRKYEQNAAAGLPHGGSQRPFGYHDDKVTIRRNEPKVIRVLAARFLAGESLRSLATWLDAEGVRTVCGGRWRTPTLRTLLASGRIAGLREHRGAVVGPAVWNRSSPSWNALGYSRAWTRSRHPDDGPRSATCYPGFCAAANARPCSTAHRDGTPAVTCACPARTTAAVGG